MNRRPLADPLERAAVAAARVFFALLARLPHGLVLAGARVLADCAFALRVRRRAMLANLDRVYGDRLAQAEKRRVARSAMRNLFLSAAEMARGSHPRARAEVAHQLEFEPRALVDDLAADARGSLLVVAHSGNFDLCGLRFTLDYGRRLAVVMKPLGTPRFDELLVGARRSYGFEVLSAQERGLVLSCAKRLREGGVVCMLPDQFARSGGVVVDFLGVPASTHAGPALAALRARGCRIFVVVDTRVGDGARHVCHVRELKDFSPSGDPRADVERLTQRLCDEMGEIVRAHPESYLWQHRRWRRHRTLSARRRRRRERSSPAAQPPTRRERSPESRRDRVARVCASRGEGAKCAVERRGRVACHLRNALLPTIEPTPGGRRIDACVLWKGSPELREMAASIEEHVRQSVPHLSGRAEDAQGVAIGENGSAPGEHSVHRAREARGE